MQGKENSEKQKEGEVNERGNEYKGKAVATGRQPEK